MACRRMYSSSAEYQTINDALFYTPERPVTFRGNELTIFDNVNTSEKRYTPWELKETTFKNVMGYCGTLVVDHMIPLSGGCGGPYIMAVISGKLPTGLRLDSETHSIRGTVKVQCTEHVALSRGQYTSMSSRRAWEPPKRPASR